MRRYPCIAIVAAALAGLLAACTYGSANIRTYERAEILRKFSPLYNPSGYGHAGRRPDDNRPDDKLAIAARGNKYVGDARAEELGQLLFFFDGFTATDGYVNAEGQPFVATSCAGCHLPAHNFADTRDISRGASGEELSVRTPSLVNARNRHFLTWNGRADSLWSQALLPLENPDEMHSNRLRVIHAVRTDARLRAAYEAVFDTLPPELDDLRRFPADALPDPDEENNNIEFELRRRHRNHQQWLAEHPSHRRSTAGTGSPQPAQAGQQQQQQQQQQKQFTPPSDGVATLPPAAWPTAWAMMSPADRATATRIFVNIGKAIDAYEQRIVADRSKFDLFLTALAAGDEEGMTVLDPEAQEGLRLFIGPAGCVRCHHGPDLTDDRFHYLGVDERPLDPNSPIEKHPELDARNLRWLQGAFFIDGWDFKCTGPHADGCGRGARRRLERIASVESITSRPERGIGQKVALGQVRTPTLRNVAENKAFMHSGVYHSLDEILAFYSNPSTSPLPAGFRRRDRRLHSFPPRYIQPLKKFLEALTDPDWPTGITTNPWTTPAAPPPSVTAMPATPTPAGELQP